MYCYTCVHNDVYPTPGVHILCTFGYTCTNINKVAFLACTAIGITGKTTQPHQSSLDVPKPTGIVVLYTRCDPDV